MAELADAVRAIEPRADVTFDEGAASQPFVLQVSGARTDRDLGFRMTPLDSALRRHMDRALALRGSPVRYAAAKAG